MKVTGALEGLFLLIVSFIVFAILSIVGIIYSLFKRLLKGHMKELYWHFGDRFKKLALLYDQKGNIQLGEILNDLFIKEGTDDSFEHIRLRYGHQDDTISDITGRLLMMDGLNKAGKGLQEFIDYVFLVFAGEKDHCLNSLDQITKETLQDIWTQ